MSDKLYSLGAFAYRRRFTVLIIWALILATTISLMVAFQKPAEDSLSIPGTESQLAFDQLAESFPQASGGSGRIVFAVPEDQQISDYESVITDTLNKVSQIEDVAVATNPFQTGAISQSGRIALSQVQLTVGFSEVDENLANNISKVLEETRTSDLQAESGGDIIARAPGQILGAGELVGVAVAAVTLMITFGAFLAAGMPLVTAFIGVGVGVSSIFASSYFVDINATTPTLAVMLGLAVGIDYSLFIITRHRKYLMDGLPLDKAASRAISTAGNAVIFAALTVVIALSALSVIGIPFVTTMGLAAAGTVAIASIVAVTLTPALLGFVGYKVLSKKQRKLLKKHKAEETPVQLRKSLAHRWGVFITSKPFIPIFFGVTSLLIIAIPLTDLQLGFPGDNTAETTSTERKAYDLVSEGFGSGFSGPILAVVSVPEGLQSAGEFMPYIEQITGRFMQTEGVSVAMFGGVSEDGRTAIIQVIPKTGPSDEKTKELVSTLRANSDQIAGADTSIALTGSVALLIDIDQKLSEALPKYLIVVVGLAILLLIIVFRSIVIPIKATLGFLLTIAATFGALVAMFQWSWFGLFEPIPVVSFLPIIVIGIVFGLAMDYEFFLVSSMRESYVHDHKDDPKAAVVDGFVYGSRVVTAAAIIMISVFAGFITHHEQMIQMMGFALAFGVLVDAFIVRMTIVPAVMSLAGKSAWWLPKWLDRILPNVSIEGKEQPTTKSK